MKYKALMLDVDGTLIPYDYDASPSKKIISSIQKAKEKVLQFLVTGRAYNSTKPILDTLGINSGLVVVNGGACVINIETDELIYDKYIKREDAEKIIHELHKRKIKFYVKKDPYEGSAHYDPFTGHTVEKCYMFFCMEDYDHEQIVDFFNSISPISNLTLHKQRHKDPQKYGFNITHGEATKLHGIEIIMKEYGLKRHEIIGVGDGYNDFPLLMSSGLKVAMGNAIDELKEIADYIAPSVTDDGVADVIEKFIIKS